MMTRTRWISGTVAVIALTMSACSDAGPQQLSEDDLIGGMEDVCRDAKNSINDLDSEDANYLDDVLDVIKDGMADLDKLVPPADLEDDFNDFTANLEDQYSEGQNLRDAIADNDQEAASESASKLDDLSKESNEIAESMGADRCVDVNGGSSEPTASVPADSVPADSVPADTTPNTPLPIDTTPVEAPSTEPPLTDPADVPDTGVAVDASLYWGPPAGYEWGTLDDLAGTAIPADDPVLGPILDAYYAGIVNSTSGGNGALFYVTQLTSADPWTAEQLAAYYEFELVSDGTDTTTPEGRSARVKANAIDGFDAAVLTVDGFGVSVLAPTGDDVLGLLDAFSDAQDG